MEPTALIKQIISRGKVDSGRRHTELLLVPKPHFFEDFVEHFVAHLIEIRPFRQSARQSGRLSVPKNVLLGQALPIAEWLGILNSGR